MSGIIIRLSRNLIVGKAFKLQHVVSTPFDDDTAYFIKVKPCSWPLAFSGSQDLPPGAFSSEILRRLYPFTPCKKQRIMIRQMKNKDNIRVAEGSLECPM